MVKHSKHSKHMVNAVRCTAGWTARVGILVACLSSAGALAQEGPSPALSDAELAELVTLLDSAQDGLMARLTGMTDGQWRFKPGPDRWSVGECVEHITRGEAALLESIVDMIAGPSDPEWFAKTNGKLELIQRYVPNRGPQGQGGVQAPEEIRPTENWDRRHGIAEFYATHGRARAFVETMRRDIKDRTMESSLPVFGWLNAYDRLFSLGLHIVRHTKQIAEVQADPGYPAKPAPAVAAEPDPRLSDEELAELISTIDEAQDVLLGRISGMSDEQWTFKEDPSRWSVAECVEHIVRGARAILDGIAYALAGPPNPDWYEQTRGKLDLVRQSVGNRPARGAGSPFRAPYEVAPTQHWDRARALEELYLTLGEMRALVETMPREIKNRTFMNPFPQLGMLNVHDWLTLTALHVMRHTKQIVEVQEHADYPARSAGGR